MKHTKGMTIWALMALTAISLLGCGKPAMRESLSTTEDGPYLPSDNPDIIIQPNPTNLSPVIKQRVDIRGYTGATFDVYTRDVLRVRVTPGKADRSDDGTAFIPKYSGLGGYVKVGSQDFPTPLLGTGESSPQQSSRIYELSQSFTQVCPSSEPDCRQKVTLTIHKPNYNYWCYSHQMCNPYYTHVHETHWVNFTVEVETNDTQKLY